MNHSNREFADTKHVLRHLQRLKQVETINAIVLGFFIYGAAIGIFLSGSLYADHAQQKGTAFITASPSTVSLSMGISAILVVGAAVSAYLFYSLVKRRKAVEKHIHPRITSYFYEHLPEHTVERSSAATDSTLAEKETVHRAYVSYDIWSLEKDSTFTATIRTKWQGFHLNTIESDSKLRAESAADLKELIDERLDQLDTLIQRTLYFSSSDISHLRTPDNQLVDTLFQDFVPAIKRPARQKSNN
ncbi:hypothetical protein ACFO4L_01110 [Bacillus daqingensis]|uniref:Uncharacterized protein n=1 Tax=Bacillus daqingensis TaxID=872396 RepID=A0ABV9NRW2_9BACI